MTYEMGSVQKCFTCRKITKDNQKCIRCDDCHQWLHKKCTGLSNSDYSKFEQDPGLEYKCAYCKNFKCTSCNKHVYDNQQGIWCDDCNFWTHLKCTKLNLTEYNEFSIDPTKLWFCKNFRFTILPFSNIDDRKFRSFLGITTSKIIEKEIKNTYIKTFSSICSVCNRKLSKPSASWTWFFIPHTNTFVLNLLKFEGMREIKPDIAGFAETMLEEKDQVEIEGYKMIRNDRNKEGGGILFRVKENLRE